jgi:ABC-type molybdate transport system ATPase subunit
VGIDEELCHMCPPERDSIFYVDEVIPGELRQDLKKVGLVRLKIDGTSLLEPNNQTFEEAFRKYDISLQNYVILLQEKSVNIRDRIRQHIEASDVEIEARWAPKKKIEDSAEFI